MQRLVTMKINTMHMQRPGHNTKTGAQYKDRGTIQRPGHNTKTGAQSKDRGTKQRPGHMNRPWLKTMHMNRPWLKTMHMNRPCKKIMLLSRLRMQPQEYRTLKTTRISWICVHAYMYTYIYWINTYIMGWKSRRSEGCTRLM
jgi:hypothetical protein